MLRCSTHASCSPRFSPLPAVYAFSEIIVIPEPTDRSLFPGATSKPLLTAGTTLVLTGEDAAVDGANPPITLRWCVRDERGEALGVGATGGEGETLKLEQEPPFESDSTFIVEGSSQKLSVRFSNLCGWGRVSPDLYQNRGCAHAGLDPSMASELSCIA